MLVQGFDDSGLEGVAAGTVYSYNDQITDGRGNITDVDFFTLSDISNTVGAFAVFKIGASQLFKAAISQHVATAKPAYYCLTPIDAQGGQTFEFTLDNTLGASQVGAVPHLYYENDFEQDEQIAEAFARGFMGFHFQDYTRTIAAGVKGYVAPIQTVPIDLGDVIGVELITDHETIGDLYSVFITLQFGGVNVFDTVSALLPYYHSTRSRIFPIRIEGGQTYGLTVTNNSGSAVSVGVRLYFDGIVKDK